MTENDRNLLIGHEHNNPNTISLINSKETKPTPKIEKPIEQLIDIAKLESDAGPKQNEITLLDIISEEELKNIGDAVNGRNPWEY